jgi:Ala-tRNA(Pro) deacylase
MSLGTRLFVHELEANSVPYELLRHGRTSTAAMEAQILGLSPAAVAKTIVLETPNGFVRAVLPASHRLDLHKLRDVLEEPDVHLATEETLAGAFPEFELGAVPPLAGPPDKVLVDRRVVDRGTLVLEAGSHEESVRLNATDLLAASRARIADICED